VQPRDVQQVGGAAVVEGELRPRRGVVQRPDVQPGAGLLDAIVLHRLHHAGQSTSRRVGSPRTSSLCYTPDSNYHLKFWVQRDSLYSLAESTRESPVMPPPPVAVGREQPIARAASCKAMAAASSAARASCHPSSTAVPDPSDHVWAHHFNLLNSAPAPVPPPFDASRATTSSRDEASVSVSNASDMEATEWVEQDEPGVCVTIREFGDGARELRRVRFRYVHMVASNFLSSYTHVK
jgi:hypothetical protein